MMKGNFKTLLGSISTVALCTLANAQAALPVVDLGYAVHQATLNVSSHRK